MLVGNLDFGQVDALNASIEGLLASMMGVHTAAQGVGASIVPPTMDMTSLMGQTQQTANFTQFSSMIAMGWEQLQDRIATTTAVNQAQQVAELGSKLAFGAF